MLFRKRQAFSVSAAAILSCLFALDVGAQAVTEVRDPLRGLTFYSAQISTDPITAVQTEGSRFSRTDQVTLGLSALFFDESDSVDEYVLWLRHDGPRRWFVGSDDTPLRINLDGSSTDYSPLHRSGTGETSGATPLIEKLEFSISPEALREIIGADSVTIELQTLLGQVVKTLTLAEHGAISRFAGNVHTRHEAVTPDR